MKQISSLLKSFRFVAQAPQMRFLFILLFIVLPYLRAQQTILDHCESTAGWKTIASEGVAAALATAPGVKGRCLKVDFDFRGNAGYFIVQRKAPTTLTSNYAINFFIKADAQSNNVELKFLDETGDNVWWHIRRGYEFPTTWTKLITRPRNIQFAWGPLGSGELKAFDKFEIAISAGKGGKGAIYLDEFVLEEKSSDTTRHRVEVMMTEQIRGYSQDSVRVGEDKVKINRVREGKGNRFVRLDLGASRELGGLVIEWDSVLFARDYRILLSDDARKWSEHYRVKDGNGGKDFIPLPDAETRYVRVQVTSPGDAAIGVRSLHIKPVEFSLTSNAFFTNVAQESPIGFYPRIWLGEQSYWTVFGVRGDMSEALISEEGRIELNKESPSIEPFLFLNGKLTTWSDVKLSQSLEDGFLPVPSMRWEKEGLALIITAFADGAPDASSLNVRYRVVNSSKQMQRGKFYLAVRPFQVNPPWQELNTVGGVAKISSLEYRDSSVWINRRIRVGYPIVPAQVGVASFEGGDIVEYLAKGILPPSTRVQDKPGYSSCAVAYDVDLAPAESAEFYAVSAFHSTQAVKHFKDRDEAKKWFDIKLNDQKADWREQLDRVQISIPGEDSVYTQAVRSTLAYTLVNRDGAGIQPGSRVYERSWIRDGVLTAGALLRLGHAQEVREFLEWYAKFQFPNGKIPCVVDRRGADPVPEHDSPGQFIHGVYEYYAFTRDERFLMEMFDHVRRAVAYIDSLRLLRTTEEYLKPGKRAYYGLLPESISHEGYSAKPMHSYWDNFFALRGLEDAARIASAIGEKRHAEQFAQIESAFRRDLLTSLTLTIQEHGISYVPGCVELGDFDATSTAIAANIGLDLRALPDPYYRNTFQRYYDFFTKRRNGEEPWETYTPYEHRIANALIRLGEPERAHELIRWILNDRRPKEWNEWAEVVWRGYRAPRFIGDMPHTWCGTEFILSVRSMFVYEREWDTTLVVGAGFRREWLADQTGVAATNLPTYYGTINLRAMRQNNRVVYELGGSLRDNARVLLKSPILSSSQAVLLNGLEVATTREGGIIVNRLPARVEIIP